MPELLTGDGAPVRLMMPVYWPDSPDSYDLSTVFRVIRITGGDCVVTDNTDGGLAWITQPSQLVSNSEAELIDNTLSENVNTTANMTNIKEFPTGAVRSKDADMYRFDLITPVGLECAARNAARVYEILGPNLADAPSCLSAATHCVYAFLAGGTVDSLGAAAVALMAACGETNVSFSKGTVEPRYDLLSPAGVLAVASAYREGAAKYGAFNCEKGFPAHDLLNHAIRHIYLFLSGDATEDHLGHAAWGVLMAIHSSQLWPHLNEGTLRSAGCVPPAPRPA